MAAPHWTAEQAIESALIFGFTGVDLMTAADFGQIHPKGPPDLWEGVRQFSKTCGIHIPSLFCYNTVTSRGEANWSEMHRSIIQLIKVADSVGALNIRIFVGAQLEDWEDENYYQKNVALLRSILPYAEHFQIGIVIQNHSSKISAMDCFRLVADIQHPMLKMALSPDHCFMSSEPYILELARENRQHIQALYINDGYMDPLTRNFHDTLPGEGSVPLADYLRIITPETWITLKYEKVWKDNLLEPQQSLPAAMKFIQNAIPNLLLR